MKRVRILLATALFALSTGAFAQSSWQTTGNTNTDGVLGTKSGYNHPIKLVTNGIPRMYIANGGSNEHSGYVGINTVSPKQMLHVVGGNILITRTSAKDGKAPGSTNPTKKLSVNGSVLAKEVIVSNESTNWPDYVFSSDYEQMSLGDLEAFVKANSHLPGVPSAAEVEKEGVKLGEMNTVLLRKVEELTRYVIDLQKQIDELKQGKE